jgi:hypothetical protein
LIYIDVLSSRRRISCALFISDVFSLKIDCPIILSSFRLNVYLYNTWYRFLIKEDPHRTNHGINEPLNGAIRIFDEFLDLFEFGGSRNGFRVRINERMGQSSCICFPSS